MNQRKPILHARDHMPGGADPLPFILPRARVWGDFGMEQFDINNIPFTSGGSGSKVFPFNLGYTSDDATFTVNNIDGGASWEDTMLIYIKRGGVYSATFALNSEDRTYTGGPPATTFGRDPLVIEYYEPDWYGYDGSMHYEIRSGYNTLHTVIFTVRNDVLTYWGEEGMDQYLVAWVPVTTEAPASTLAYTFGDADFSHETWWTGCYLEITRLGDAYTDDIHDGDEDSDPVPVEFEHPPQFRYASGALTPATPPALRSAKAGEEEPSPAQMTRDERLAKREERRLALGFPPLDKATA